MGNSKKQEGFFPKWCVFPHYKWCGPGCSGPGTPINAVDAACRNHDLCYQKYGPTCKCDRLFLRQLESTINPHTKEGRQALLIYRYMRFQTFFKCN
jgi:Phospholipase A2-like domain